MKIVVIGGTGLIGSKVVARLTQNGHSAIAASPNTGVNTITGEGLTAALKGAAVVVDVSNSPSFEEAAVMEFFTTSTRNLLAQEALAGMGHHVALSVVGTNRLTDSAYFRAKIAQEKLIKESPIPYSIVHATQFFEFVKSIADSATEGGKVRLAPVLIQPMAAHDVASAVARVAVGKPLNGTIEIAGPEQFRLDELIRQGLRARNDSREVIADSNAHYFGAKLGERTLVPGKDARLGETRFADWLKQSTPTSATRPVAGVTSLERSKTMTSSTQQRAVPVNIKDTWDDRRRAFRSLHERGCFVIPNPWDVGSARYLQHLGFSALATTSAGFAFSQGLPDSDVAVARDRSLTHIAEIAAAIDVPVNADFASAYAVEPQDVADNITLCVATGVAGLSIEDATGDPSKPLYDLPLAVERVRAARQAIDRAGGGVLLTARAECYHVGQPDPFRETVRRLQAYAEAGADVLFAPGPQKAEEIKGLVAAVKPKPFNLLVARDIGLSVDDIAALGVRRISVGGALALAAWTGFMRAAKTLKSEGSFAGLTNLVPYAEINDFFSAEFERHHGA